MCYLSVPAGQESGHRLAGFSAQSLIGLKSGVAKTVISSEARGPLHIVMSSFGWNSVPCSHRTEVHCFLGDG